MIFEIVIKALLLFLYILVTGYVMTFGKSRSGLITDYIIFSVLVVLMLFRM